MKFYEKVNVENLDKVINCTNLPLNPDSDDENWEDIFRKTLIKYRNNVKDNKIEIVYKQKDKIGRHTSSYGFQNLQGDVRKYLANDNYIDLDISNCHPVILNKLINQYLVKDKTNVTNFMSEYCLSRQRFLEKYDMTKISFLKFMNCDINNNHRLSDLHTQIYSKLVPILKKNNKFLFDLIKSKNKGSKYNLNGKFLATYLQNIENTLLMTIVDFVKNKNITIGSLIHDGLMYEKVNGTNPLNEEDIKDLEDYIFNKTGFAVKIVFKSTEIKWVPEGCLENDKLLNITKEMECEDQDSEIVEFTIPCVVYKVLDLAGKNIVYTGESIWYKNSKGLWVDSEENLKPLLVQYGLNLYYYKKDDEEKTYIMGLVSNWSNYITFMVNYIKVYSEVNMNFVNTLNIYQGFIPFQDFVYNLKTKEKIPIFDFNYPLTKTCGMFPKTKNKEKIKECDNFLLQNFNGNKKEMKEFFKFMIRSLGREIFKKWMLVFGERNSGKTTIIKMIDYCFSGLYGSIDGDALGYKKGSFETPEKINGALSPLCEYNLVCSSEMKAEKLCSEKIKTATSGGDKVTYRKAYGTTKIKPMIGSLVLFMNTERPATHIDCFHTSLVYNMPCYFEDKPDPDKYGIWKEADSKYDNWVKENMENRDAFVHLLLSFYEDNNSFPCFEEEKEEMVERLRGSDPFELFCNLIEFTNNKDDFITNEGIRKIIQNNNIDLTISKIFTPLMNRRGSEPYRRKGIRGYSNVKFKTLHDDLE